MRFILYLRIILIGLIADKRALLVAAVPNNARAMSPKGLCRLNAIREPISNATVRKETDAKETERALVLFFKEYKIKFPKAFE